jgi:hypothetical protein
MMPEINYEIKTAADLRPFVQSKTTCASR